ncbi:hypothetical protein [Pseudanabaena sp. FACHB-2040]|uniref:hypothetical protein n=1 Tax=Pseudanabaena sp. FACHB-2040 TaxID=2692859 RepID=UPI00168457E7|nr:hypothetical protein [Pseudanabaena sp. FACHB-2040]MBD2259914.1 hypothetical protein [Pseudanabaena sp. FACHB-2040]
MSWQPLGTFSPTKEWKTLGTLTNGGSLFRIRQDWVGDWPGTGYLQISFVYEGAGRYGFRKVGSDKEDRVLNCPISEALAAEGFTSRQMAIKLNLYARLYSGANWVVSVDQWIDDDT